MANSGAASRKMVSLYGIRGVLVFSSRDTPNSYTLMILVRTGTFYEFGALLQGSWEFEVPSLSGPLRLRVQSRSRTRLRIAASIAFLFRACFEGVLETIAPLSRGSVPQAV